MVEAGQSVEEADEAAAAACSQQAAAAAQQAAADQIEQLQIQVAHLEVEVEDGQALLAEREAAWARKARELEAANIDLESAWAARLEGLVDKVVRDEPVVEEAARVEAEVQGKLKEAELARQELASGLEGVPVLQLGSMRPEEECELLGEGGFGTVRCLDVEDLVEGGEVPAGLDGYSQVAVKYVQVSTWS